MADPNVRRMWHLSQAVFVPLECVSTALLVLRLWTRWKMIGKLAHDDASLIAAWISMTLAFFFTVASGNYMNDFLAGDGPSTGLSTFIKFRDFAFAFSIAMTKFSLIPNLLQVHRTRKGEKDILHITAVVVFVTTVIGGMFSLLTCGPTAALYGTTVECKLSNTYGQILIAYIGFDTVSTMALVLLSLHGLIMAEVPLLLKLATSANITLGIAAAIAAMARLAVLLGAKLQPTQEGALLSSLINTIELSCCMAAVCLFQSYPAFGFMAAEFRAVEEVEQPYGTPRPVDLESQASSNTAGVESADVIAHVPLPSPVTSAASVDEKSMDPLTPSSHGSDDEEKRLGA